MQIEDTDRKDAVDSGARNINQVNVSPDKDTETSTYKSIYCKIEKECKSFKKFAVKDSVISMIVGGCFAIGKLKIHLPKIIEATSKFLFIAGNTVARIALGGIPLLLSFIFDVCKCFYNLNRRKYCPNNKQRNRQLFIKEISNVIKSSAFSAAIGLIICYVLI